MRAVVATVLLAAGVAFILIATEGAKTTGWNEPH